MLNREKHRNVLFSILTDVFASDIGKYVAFKGGTLCYFLYGLDRFSTDLDFDLLDASKIQQIARSMPEILKKYGTVKHVYDKTNTLFFLLSYGEADMNVKVEIGKRIWKANRYETVNFYGFDAKAMALPSVTANKLVALTDRNQTANRDYYDVWFFLKNGFPIDWDVVFERTWKNKTEYLEFLHDFIQWKFPGRSILNGLWEVLSEKQKDWAKNRLKAELLGLVEREGLR